MNDIKEKALAFAKERLIDRLTAVSLLEQNRAEVEYFDGEALLARMKGKNLHMLCANGEATALRAVSGRRDIRLMVTDISSADEKIGAALGFRHAERCFNVYYPKKTPPECPANLRFESMGDEMLDAVCARYQLLTREQVRAHLEEKTLFGGWLRDKWVGFIGIHDERSMGMLYIEPEFRRQGMGFCMEALLIRHMLSMGERVYAQVFCDNTASLRLQKKLGMVQSENTNSWFWE